MRRAEWAKGFVLHKDKEKEEEEEAPHCRSYISSSRRQISPRVSIIFYPLKS